MTQHNTLIMSIHLTPFDLTEKNCHYHRMLRAAMSSEYSDQSPDGVQMQLTHCQAQHEQLIVLPPPSQVVCLFIYLVL
jgi:hypothetical protein